MKDSVGNDIVEGCIIRWLHFATPKRKHYMYKQVGKIAGKKTQIHHLPYGEGSFTLSNYLSDENVLEDVVVVSAPYEADGIDLKRSKTLRD